MNIHEAFRNKLASGRKLLIPYICAGAPTPEATLAILEALAEAGADAIELGIPFSDPLMDGPVILEASHHALKAGMNLEKTLEIAKAFTAQHRTPLIAMGSVNPILRMGAERFARRAQEVGISGCILPDLPLEDQHRLPGLAQVQLVAPNTPDKRVQALLAQNPPFLYAITVFGVTGARNQTAEYTLPFLRRMKNLATVPVPVPVPVLAGFGVSNPAQAVELASACDGVIIGSALIRAMNAQPGFEAEAAKAFLEPIRKALDGMPLKASEVKSCC